MTAHTRGRFDIRKHLCVVDQLLRHSGLFWVSFGPNPHIDYARLVLGVKGDLEDVAEARVKQPWIGLDLDAPPAEGGPVGPDVVELGAGCPLRVQPPGASAAGFYHQTVLEVRRSDGH